MRQQLLPGPRPEGGVALTRRWRLALFGGLACSGVVFFLAAPSGSPASFGRATGAEPQAPTEQAPPFLGLWAHAGPCPAERLHDVVFVVRQKGREEFERMVHDRSDPRSPNFRQWLTREQVLELTRNSEGLAAIRAALASLAGASVVRVSGEQFVRARAPAAAWEAFLGTRLHLYRHRDGGSHHARAEAYTLPRHLRDHVEGVLGVLDLPDLPRGAANPQQRVVWNRTFPMPEELATTFPGFVTPDLIRHAYNMPPMASAGSEEALRQGATSQAVFASLKQYWSPRDRLQFERAFDLPDHKVTELDEVGGETEAASSNTKCMSDGNSCIEANLDVQYMLAMSPWSEMGLYYAESSQELFLEFAEALLDMPKPPHVVSISYGGPEVMRSASTIKAFNSAASKLAAMGTTLLASSGDDGANGIGPFVPGKVSCADIQKGVGLVVNWPASSPWVTSVGATMGIESGSPEIACSVDATGPTARASRYMPSITSGGGFSASIPRPFWQPEYPGKTTRGVPDVSLAGHAYVVRNGGRWVPVDGTSASSPAFASMVAVINAHLNAPSGGRRLGEDEELAGAPEELSAQATCGTDTGGTCRVLGCHAWRGPVVCARYSFLVYKCICPAGFCAEGGVCRPARMPGRKRTVGWLNPLLYQHAGAFRDVTGGSNRCARSGAECCGGYSAGPGWDPATGLGVPDFGRLMSALTGA